jgi:hypothetical protein
MDGNIDIEGTAKVREQLSKLKLVQEAYAQILARLAVQQAALIEFEARRDAAAGRLTERETDIARSGEFTDSALPEELEIANLARRSRIVSAGISAIKQEAAAAKLALDFRAEQVRLALEEFGVQGYRRLAARYRETAGQLRDIVFQQLVWLESFQTSQNRHKMPSLGIVIAEDAETGKAIIDSRWDFTKAAVNLAGGTSGATELYERLLALRSEVQAVMQGERSGKSVDGAAAVAASATSSPAESR